jgi:type I restriction enzyme M protein
MSSSPLDDLPDPSPIFESAGKQKQALFAKVWDLQNQLRGGLDGWEFKNYILGFLFYRFISDDFSNYIDEQNNIDKSVQSSDLRRYQNLSDAEVESWKPDLVGEKGFFIYPSQLFINVVKAAKSNQNLNEELAQVFKDIEGSSVGTASENDFKHLFIDVDINSPKLGHAPQSRNEKLSNIITKISELNFDFSDSLIDVLGDTYEYLIGQYASHAGKAGGEFFTPQEVSNLLAKLAIAGREDVSDLKVYDPACGSGSLLLKFAREVGQENIQQFSGQELNPTTFNLARMNMFLHGVPYDKFSLVNGDTLRHPGHLHDTPFDCIVANPPYSIKWAGSDDPLLINDDRFAPAGVLAPKSKADLAFIMHALYSLANDGTAAIVEFPGVLYRGGAERKIRQYLVDNNFIDTIIQLPPDLFFGTSIATCIIVLKKNKSENKTLFIDASLEFARKTKQNHLTLENIEKIISGFTSKQDEAYFARYVDNTVIKDNDYNLTVNKYVIAEEIDNSINIHELNLEIIEIVERENQLRSDINAIVATIEGEGQ